MSANFSFRTTCCPAYVSTAAAALPPNWVFSSAIIISWAPATFPASTMALIIASWSAVNCTPLRLSADKPAMGSLSALPTCIAALSRSIPSACDMSRMDCVALPKFSPLMLVNVARTFCAPRMASSLNND